ncbi:MAG: hypothetical protein PHE27_06495 [Alphaproteobacteria bacterium]|nr:hypothetical protein [Alphaproteobacteria bacterium]
MSYISVRTPLRVSFFGGGTDYPEYFRDHPAAVLGMAINRYVYINALRRPAFSNHEFTLAYSQLERIAKIEDIQHPALRVALQEFKHHRPLDISTMADLPAQSGLGSSASFMVGLINLLATLNDKSMTKLQIAQMAIDLEREKLCHTCGVQDQLHAAFGGINYFDLSDGRIRINPILMTAERLKIFRDSLVLVFTGLTRSAPKVLKEQMAATSAGKIDKDLNCYYEMAKEGVRLLDETPENDFVRSFGKLMHEGWLRKRQFSGSISNPDIDDLYQKGLDCGAYGGKLCGAGGGGFILFVVPPEMRNAFISCFEAERILEVDLDTQGTSIISHVVSHTPRNELSALEDEDERPVAAKTETAAA